MWEDTFLMSTTRSIQVLLVLFKRVVVKGRLFEKYGIFMISRTYIYTDVLTIPMALDV